MKNEPQLKQARTNNQLLKKAVQDKQGNIEGGSDQFGDLLQKISSEESPETKEIKAAN